MRILIIQLFFAITVFGWLHAQPITYAKADGKTYVRLISKQHHIKPEAGYNAEMLIPHWNPDTHKWGYIKRDSKELVVPHRFFSAGTFGAGFAIAVELQDDSVHEDVFRIDQNGEAKCIFRDTSKAELENSNWENKDARDTWRQRDDYVLIMRGNSLTVISPKGERCFGKNFSCERHKISYLGCGRLAWDVDSVVTFTGEHGEVTAQFSMKDYKIPNLNTLKTYDIHGEILQPIVRLRDHKVGILGSAGQILVPISWDTVGTWLNGALSMQTLSDGLLARYYEPDQDSLFFAWRDGYAHLVHLDGSVIYRYSHTQSPVASSIILAWPEQGLIPALLKDNAGKPQAYAYIDPQTGGQIVSGSQVLMMNANVAAKLNQASSNRDSYSFKDLRGLPQVRFPIFEKYPEWRITQTFRYQGRYYHRIHDPKTGLFGLMNENGNITIPVEKNQIVDAPNENPNATISTLNPHKKGMIEQYTPDGKLLFDMILKPEKIYFDEGMTPKQLQFLRFAMHNLLSYGEQYGVPYANRLEFAAGCKRKGRIYIGYVDIYGQVYY